MDRPALTAQPGSLLARLIYEVTGTTGRSGCSCDRRRRAMDRWGWQGCWRRRQLILKWVCEEARARGHSVDATQVAPLFTAALRELRRHQGDAG
jgi:hypothetical protein